jgi:hypothetical protein
VKRYKACYENDLLHRLDGPAVVYADGTKEWWVFGVRHRLDGPAVEDPNGSSDYWVNGKQYSEEEFEELTYPNH